MFEICIKIGKFAELIRNKIKNYMEKNQKYNSWKKMDVPGFLTAGLSGTY